MVYFDHFLTDRALLSISPTGRGQLVKMLITIEPHSTFVNLDEILHTYLFQQCPATCIQIGDEAAGRI